MALFGNFFGNGAQNNPGANPVNPMGNNTPMNPGGQQTQPQKRDQPSNDPNQMKDPVELYKDLWTNPTSPVGSEAPEYSLNPETISKVANSMDFSQGLPEEIVERMNSGEQPSWQDVMTMINHVGRQTYARAMEHQSKTTGKFVDLHSKHSLASLPNMIKQHMTQSKVSSLPAAQGNPVVQEQMRKIAEQLQSRFPDATEEWITEQTQNYFLEIAKAIKPEAFAAPRGNGSSNEAQGSFDWDTWMTQEPKRPGLQ